MMRIAIYWPTPRCKTELDCQITWTHNKIDILFRTNCHNLAIFWARDLRFCMEVHIEAPNKMCKKIYQKKFYNFFAKLTFFLFYKKSKKNLFYKKSKFSTAVTNVHQLWGWGCLLPTRVGHCQVSLLLLYIHDSLLKSRMWGY